MNVKAMARRTPGRLATGVFILHSGLAKWDADEQTAGGLHGTAVTAYPFLGTMKPEDFARLLSAAEITLGSALLLPVVPAGLAGAGLAAFAGGLLGLYARVPGMRKEGSPFPSQQGTAIFKDMWMLGIGLGLLIDALTDRGSS